jgi:hypothetical protein
MHDEGGLEIKKDIQGIIGFLGKGIEAVNHKLKFDGRSPLYCVSDKLAVTKGQYFNIFLRTIKWQEKI